MITKTQFNDELKSIKNVKMFTKLVIEKQAQDFINSRIDLYSKINSIGLNFEKMINSDYDFIKSCISHKFGTKVNIDISILINSIINKINKNKSFKSIRKNGKYRMKK